MEAQIYIAISGKTYPVKEVLKKKGLTWNGKVWSGEFTIDKIDMLKEMCQKFDLQYKIEGEGIKESRFVRSQRSISQSAISAVIGEGRLQWEIEETLKIENLRHKKREKTNNS